MASTWLVRVSYEGRDMRVQGPLLDMDGTRSSPVFRHRYSTEASARHDALWGLKPFGQCSKPGSLNPGER